MAMKQAHQARAERTRERLLDATRRIVAERGYDLATVDEITDAAGVSKGAFYFHFESKDDALVALVERWKIDLGRELDSIEHRDTAGATVAESLRGLLTAGWPAWQPRLIVEFTRMSANQRVATVLADAGTVWRRSAAKVLLRARKAGSIDPSLSVDSLVSTLAAIRDGLLLQGCAQTSSRAAQLRAATRTVCAFVLPPRALRRAG
jgi:AcrR family transcriptional regulator